jgi:hypothetical protein
MYTFTPEQSMASKYHQVVDGTWVDIAQKFRNQCCDCGLVHDWQFRKVGRHLEFRVVTNNRATAAARRHFKFTKDKED